jgi:hypothetical protein
MTLLFEDMPSIETEKIIFKEKQPLSPGSDQNKSPAQE